MDIKVYWWCLGFSRSRWLFFLWFPVVFDGFKAVFSGFKSVVNNLLMIKHLKIYDFCFLCTLKFLGTGWARSPAFWVCLTSTLLRQLASLSSSFLMHANTRLIPFTSWCFAGLDPLLAEIANRPPPPGKLGKMMNELMLFGSDAASQNTQQNSIYPRGHQTNPSHTKPKYN